MKHDLIWLDDKTFKIDEAQFYIDTTPGPHRRISEKNFFTLVKTKKYIEEYTSIKENNFQNILELGMFEGGSLVLLDKLFSPQKMVGIDIRKDSIPALDDYILNISPYISTYYSTSQDDQKKLDHIIKKDLCDKLDLVVDDASHSYELTKKSFVHLFPKLSSGGLYIIEDWAWSLKPGAQDKNHPWFKKSALLNLIYEVIAELGGSTFIEDVHITSRMVKIRKSSNANVDESILKALAFRGRTLPLI